MQHTLPPPTITVGSGANYGASGLVAHPDVPALSLFLLLTVGKEHDASVTRCFNPEPAMNLTDAYRLSVEFSFYPKHIRASGEERLPGRGQPAWPGCGRVRGLGWALGPAASDLVAHGCPRRCGPLRPHVPPRPPFAFKVNKIRGFEPQIFTGGSLLPAYLRQPQIPFQDLLTHADGTRTPASWLRAAPYLPRLRDS